VTARVTVGIVAYNDAASLETCVRSLRAVVDVPIVIVDNHSDDDTWDIASKIAAELRSVTSVRSDKNAGYAAGGNIARTHATTEYLAITNADCEFEGDWLTPLVSYLDDHPNVAAASPTVAVTGNTTLNAEGLEIHKAGFGFNRHLSQPLSSAAQEPGSVPGLQGTAFVVRASTLDDIGGWYEGGFLYLEDVELSLALRLAGHDIAHVPTPSVIHDYTLTMSPEKFFLLERNRLEMLSADLGGATKLLLSPVVLATEVAVWLYALRKGSALTRAKLRSYKSFRERRSLREERRRQVRSFRKISDRELLSALQWTYPRSQTQSLHKNTPTSGRRGNREMPTS
jgi:GT2 family glycosyltransferase